MARKKDVKPRAAKPVAKKPGNKKPAPALPLPPPTPAPSPVQVAVPTPPPPPVLHEKPLTLIAASATFHSSMEAVAANVAAAVIKQLIIEAGNRTEVVQFLEAAYQKVIAGGGSDGGQGSTILPPDPDGSGA